MNSIGAHLHCPHKYSVLRDISRNARIPDETCQFAAVLHAAVM
jgi:hypothetical protein